MASRDTPERQWLLDCMNGARTEFQRASAERDRVLNEIRSGILHNSDGQYALERSGKAVRAAHAEYIQAMVAFIDFLRRK